MMPKTAPDAGCDSGKAPREPKPPRKRRVRTHTAITQDSSPPVPWRWRSRGARIRGCDRPKLLRRAGPPRAGDSDLVTSGEKTEARKSPAPPPSKTSRSPRGRLPSMTDVTRILSAIEQGDPHAAEQLLPLVYDELRKLAAVRLALEKPWR